MTRTTHSHTLGPHHRGHDGLDHHRPPISHRRRLHRHRLLHDSDRGSQALEFAMLLPLVALLMTIVLAAGQAALGVAATEQLAIAAARLAATAHDDAVIHALAGAGVHDLRIDPPSTTRRPGQLVTVTLTRPIPVMWVPHPGLATTATATHLTEDVP